MKKVAKSMLMLVILTNLAFASMQLFKTYVLGNNVNYMGMMSGNTIAVWHKDGSLRLYNASMTQMQNVVFNQSMASILSLTNEMKFYSISPDLKSIVIGMRNMYCDYHMPTNTSKCNNMSIDANTPIYGMSFMGNRNLVVVLYSYNYKYINLDSANSNQTVYYSLCI